MSDKMKDAEATPLDNHMPAPPAGEETVTTLDNHMPSEPVDITTLDNHMPAPPALDLDGGK
ncbi:hypothetical protein [Streptomyces sp. NRRL S-37]|uniref:hypothetical protein n=1 Tax=Streptomyces sp. NRRL S-37 TaxID=1463903 RepID=UPI0004C7B51B|nr:hypothetical protein [Streptomyces sp. NRRL S-37]